jgi:hypothetical protein
MLSRGHENPRRSISVSSRWGWGPSASEEKKGRNGRKGGRGGKGKHVLMRTDPASSRIWRLRKLHQQADARLREDGQGAEVQFFYNGTLAYSRRWPTRVLALAEAAEKRAELEREGWTSHW